MLGGPSLRLGTPRERLIIPSGIGWGENDTGRVVTWEFPLRADSASWKSLESFIQFTSFCNSCTLPESPTIVFWSSKSFRLAIVSKVELWNWRRLCTRTNVQCCQIYSYSISMKLRDKLWAWMVCSMSSTTTTSRCAIRPKRCQPLVMIWTKVSSIICKKGKWESLHSWRTRYRCLILILSWKSSRQATRIWGLWRTTSSSTYNRSCWFLTMSAQETEQHQRTLRKILKEGKYCRFWTSKGSCSKGGKCSFEHDPAKKGKGKGQRSRSPGLRENSAA